MCEAIEKIAIERSNETRQQNAEEMIRDGILTDEKIAQYSGLTIEQVQKLKSEMSVMA